MHLLLCIWISSVGLTHGCTNLLIPAGSTTDGSTILAYSADSPNTFGDVLTYPAASHKPEDLREIHSWDYGTKLGAIPQPRETFNVVGNTNEHQLSITETTFGGLASLSGSEGKAICHTTYGCIDYGSLEWVTLQRAKTAREAITLMDSLMQTYGYASEGESFSIADPKEVWMMEIIGKGNYSKGSVWVAIRVPDGHVGAHANQARIRSFPRDRPDSVLFSPDVVDFARRIGVYTGKDEDFSFSDTFDPVTFGGARFCEARVYSFFVAVAAQEENMPSYLDYAKGDNLTHRMPLFVKIGHKLNVNETMWHMRNHYEGLWMDPRKDVGAGLWSLPNRLGEELSWKSGGKWFVNERPIGTHYAGWNLVANQRPRARYSVLWFGVDDPTFSLHAPFYGAASRVPRSWSGANCQGRTQCRRAADLPGDVTKFTLDAMHWVGQLISNYVYSRYDEVAPVVKSELARIEGELLREVEQMDLMLAAMVDDTEAAEAATQFSYMTAERLHVKWREFFGDLFSTFVDGYTMEFDVTNEVCGCKKRTAYWSDTWKQLIANSTGDHYLYKHEDPRTEKLLYNEGQTGIAPGRDVAPPLKKIPQTSFAVIHKLSLAALGGPGKGFTPSKKETSSSWQLSLAAPALDSVISSGTDSASVTSSLPNGFSLTMLLVTNACSISLGFWVRSIREVRSRSTGETWLLESS